jgi:ribulose-phosphate 3-epimerase
VSQAETLRQLAPALSVGVLGGNLLRLEDELSALGDAGVRIVHIDVMDGVFCPPITVGAGFVAAIPETFVKDVHLMVDEPLGQIDQFLEAGADIVTFHIEATRHPHRVLQSMGGSGVIRGVALNPSTPVSHIVPLFDELEFVLVLGVNPGWSGQTLLPATGERVAQVRSLGEDVLVGVDGGITASNISSVSTFGADVVVSGSAIFGGDVQQNVDHFTSALGSPVATVTGLIKP